MGNHGWSSTLITTRPTSTLTVCMVDMLLLLVAPADEVGVLPPLLLGSSTHCTRHIYGTMPSCPTWLCLRRNTVGGPGTDLGLDPVVV